MYENYDDIGSTLFGKSRRVREGIFDEVIMKLSFELSGDHAESSKEVIQAEEEYIKNKTKQKPWDGENLMILWLIFSVLRE